MNDKKNNLNALNEKALEFFHNGDNRRATACFTAIANQNEDPDLQAFSRIFLGAICSRNGEDEKAIEHFQLVIDGGYEKEQKALAYMEKGKAYLNLDNEKEAIQCGYNAAGLFFFGSLCRRSNEEKPSAEVIDNTNAGRQGR